MKNLLTKLKNKEGLNKLKELVKYQSGDINNIEICKNKIEIKSTKSGYITDIDSIKLASLANSLGAGRKSKDDAINYGVGIELCKKVNDKIEENDTLGYVFTNDAIDQDEFNSAFVVNDTNIDEISIIYEVLK